MANNRRSERLREVLRKRGTRRRWEAIITLIVVMVAIVIPLLTAPRLVGWLQAKRRAAAEAGEVREKPAIQYAYGNAFPIQIHKDRWDEIGISVAPIQACPPPPPLSMDGVLYLDPDDFVVVRSRFQGEVVETPSGESANRINEVRMPSSVRFGDKVTKGQLLCVIWSRELGEKRSELAQAVSQLSFDQETLKRLATAGGALPQVQIREAERRVHEGTITVERIEKDAASVAIIWEDIARIREDIRTGNDSTPKSQGVDQWARVEIRSPISGTIVQKDITVGMLVDADDTLYKIADLTHLDVRAFAYEEDLAALQKLDRNLWKWDIHLKGDSSSKPIPGMIDRIGTLIDPIQHTGIVLGWVANELEQLRAGQFIRASILMPTEQKMLAVPAMAVVDVDGKNYLILQGDDVESFTPLEVQVRRYQDGLACLEESKAGEGNLSLGQHVITNGAVEVLAEYQAYLKTEQHGQDAHTERRP